MSDEDMTMHGRQILRLYLVATNDSLCRIDVLGILLGLQRMEKSEPLPLSTMLKPNFRRVGISGDWSARARNNVSSPLDEHGECLCTGGPSFMRNRPSQSPSASAK